MRLGIGVDLAAQLRIDLDADETQAARLGAAVVLGRRLVQRTLRLRAGGLPRVRMLLHETSERPHRRSWSTVAPRRSAASTRRFHARGPSSLWSRSMSRSALHSGLETGSEAVP